MKWPKDSKQVVAALAALAHEHRLTLYRMLVEAGPAGLNAGTIAARLKMPPSSFTFHVQHLHRAGLIKQVRKGRELIYSTDFDAMNGLVEFLTENCCQGDEGVLASGQTSCESVQPTVRKSRRKIARAA